MALHISLALNFLSAHRRLTPGLAFAAQLPLRWGIVLVGVRITSAQIFALGPGALLAIGPFLRARWMSVSGAGYSHSMGVGEVAAIVKLSRVVLLAPSLANIEVCLPSED